MTDSSLAGISLADALAASLNTIDLGGGPPYGKNADGTQIVLATVFAWFRTNRDTLRQAVLCNPGDSFDALLDAAQTLGQA